jgi:lipopolysaccharide transport system permease protein
MDGVLCKCGADATESGRSLKCRCTGGGNSLFNALYTYRRFIWKQAVADLRHRYAGTGMGLAWNVVHPLGVILVYSIIFSSIMKTHSADTQIRFGYTIFLCAGLFPWLAFSDCIMRSCNAFVVNASYLKKLPIPEQVFVAQNAVTTALNLAINFVLLLLLATALGLPPRWTWLLLPIPLIFLMVLGFGLGLLLGTLNVFFRDIAEWVTIFLPIAMWTVPVVYPAEKMPAALQAFFPWHPIGPPLMAVRTLFLGGHMPPGSLWIGMIAWPAVMLIVGLLAFKKLRAEIRDLV